MKKIFSTKGLVHRNPAFAGHSQALRANYQVYFGNALRRGLEFSLTPDEMLVVLKMNCHFCGAPPAERTFGNPKYKDTFNGLDRLDNSLGYTVDNTVPACSACNRGKWQMTKDEYISHAKRVAAYNS